MANQPTKDEIALYKKHRTNGDYREAAKVLLPYKDNPEIKALIDKLAQAHKRQSQAVEQIGKRKAKPKTGSSRLQQSSVVAILLVTIIVGILGMLGFAMLDSPISVTSTPTNTATPSPTSTPFPTPDSPLAQYIISQITEIEHVDDFQPSEVPGRNEQRYDLTLYLYSDADINQTLESLSATIEYYRAGNAPEGEIFSVNVDLWQGDYGETWRFTGSEWVRRSVNGMRVTSTPVPTAMPTVAYAEPPLSGGSSSQGSSSGPSSSRSSSRSSSNDTTSSSLRPENCSEAVAMGLSAVEAGRWSHLDRDGDGVACYGD